MIKKVLGGADSDFPPKGCAGQGRHKCQPHFSTVFIVLCGLTFLMMSKLKHKRKPHLIWMTWNGKEAPWLSCLAGGFDGFHTCFCFELLSEVPGKYKLQLTCFPLVLWTKHSLLICCAEWLWMNVSFECRFRKQITWLRFVSFFFFFLPLI